MQATVENREARWLTVSEFAELSRVSRPHAYRLIRAGAVPSVRLGGAIRIPADALEQLRPARRTSVATTANGRSSPLPAGTREAA
jgi:excisionase family DNA binding protein